MIQTSLEQDSNIVEAPLTTLIENLIDLNRTDGFRYLDNLLDFKYLKQFLTIDSSVIVHVLRCLDNVSLNQDLLLRILTKLSEHQWFNRINFSSGHELDVIELIFKQSSTPEIIRNNLRQNSWQTILGNLQNLSSTFNDWPQIRNDISFVSIILNHAQEDEKASFYYWNLFAPFSLFQTFANYLSHLIQSMNNLDEDAMAMHERELREILEIIYKLMSHSYSYCESFLSSNLLQIIINLFENLELVKCLYNNHVPILAKVIGVFFNLCKHAHYTTRVETSQILRDEARAFSTLRRSRDTFKSLSQNEIDLQTHEFKIYYIYVFKLVSLKYLEIKFKPKETLLDYKHYEDIVNGNFVKHTFKEVNSDFTGNGKVTREFINEREETERGLVHKLLLIYNSNNSAMARTVVDVLDNIRCVYSSDETKKLAFPIFWPFFKSVLLFGLDIERIVCLNCLQSFCQVKSIRREFFGNESVSFLLKEIMEKNANSKDEIKQRQNRMIEKILEKKTKDIKRLSFNEGKFL